MPVPQHVFDPPFNIVRASHAVLDVTDIKLSRDFYETTIGLHVEDADDNAVYLRAAEEHQHHSLVLRQARQAACHRLGFKVGDEEDLDKAAAFATVRRRPLIGRPRAARAMPGLPTPRTVALRAEQRYADTADRPSESCTRGPDAAPAPRCASKGKPLRPQSA